MAHHRFDTDLAWLPPAALRVYDPEPIVATPSPGLAELRDRLTAAWAPGEGPTRGR